MGASDGAWHDEAMPRRNAPPNVQPDLFELGAAAPEVASPAGGGQTRAAERIAPAGVDELTGAIAQRLQALFGSRLYLGTSSWSFPGWAGLVWRDDNYTETELSRHGLGAYAQHPLLRTVSLDRTFYRAIDASTYAQLARQTPDGFRFLVKAPSEITDAVLRAPDTGAALQDNPHFLDPQRALASAVRPAVEGLGHKLGALVFQISPLSAPWLRDSHRLLERFDRLWRAVVPALPASTLAAIELRDSRMLTPRLTSNLAQHGVSYCVGLHDRMPSVQRQLPAAQAAGRGDFICRWSLHQGLRYNQAKSLWAPFNRLHAPDPQTRVELAQAVVATLAGGYRAFVTINNKAEGSAPLSVVELGKAILREAGAAP
jgi:uncharacterized protein YecE (DUF72 family)